MSESTRRELLARAGNNPIRLAVQAIPFDLFSDVPPASLVPAAERGPTGAAPDEVEEVLAPLTGEARLALATKGRAAEIALVDALELAGPPIVLAHGLFSTTQAALGRRGAVIEDLPIARDGSCDVDLAQLDARLAKGGVQLVYLELANNAHFGWPLTESNVAAVRAACDRHGAKLLLDAARPLANSAAQALDDLAGSARRLLSLAHAFTVSCAKEMLVPIGSLVGSSDAALIARVHQQLFKNGTSMSWIDPVQPRGDLRDGIRYSLHHPELIRDRLALARTLAGRLGEHGVTVMQPVTAHAVYVPLEHALAPHGDVPATIALLAHLYVIAGVRGQVANTRRGPAIRLAIPLFASLDVDAIAAGVAAFVSRIADRPSLRARDDQIEPVFFRRLS